MNIRLRSTTRGAASCPRPSIHARAGEIAMHGPDTEREDALLMAAIVGGSEDALRRLYERFSGLIYTLALRIVGDPLVAQEVVQDVFLRCWERAERFEPARGRVPAWLMGITRNRAIDVLRSAAYRAHSQEIEIAAVDSQRFRHSSGGEIEAVALRLSVADALRELPAAQRQAIDLVLSAELTQREIAELLGLPLGTVKTRIRDGMARLRVQLRPASRQKDAR